ncbi:putative plastid-lipid-associated protein chloroplastic-like protein [Chrysochromulina tobinii]|uniref:Putative plastid-lipid-associated protein chloroplastic-like protein n=1 Tax=Chrysochromulina tobinii TaxID=1460289 RepID=A0A0M0JP78_9EUKA|nr:putative plastid-lipid-associated protein chloroplastic-like protein [Chrysochromulina tobinii]|eukprot:KOO28300.1 putative plastid-lipid-associated protein chloroplastic-like protein [Chrysochromulina sp. CCMP291]
MLHVILLASAALSQSVSQFRRGPPALAALTVKYDSSRAVAIVTELAQRSIGALPEAEGTARLKSSVLELLAPYGDPALGVPSATFDEIDAKCRALEARNPTGASTAVAALDGAWRVRFSDAPPPSNGALGPLRGRAFQIVDVASRTYRNELSLFGGAVQLSLAATFEQPSASKAALRVAFRTLTATLGGVALPSIQFPTGTERTWLLTYTDADTRVVRAGVDGGRSTARELGLIKQGEGESPDSYLFYLTRAPPEEAAPASFWRVVSSTMAAAGQRRALKTALMQACEGQRLGAATDEAGRARIINLIRELEQLNPTARPAQSTKLLGTWRVVWTTESELLALTNSGLLGLPCQGASQTIGRTAAADERGAQRGAFDYSLSNEISFEGGFLRVGSSCEPQAQGGRVNFRFESCAAKWRSVQLPLPPVGSGWFEVLYLDEDLRLCTDVRGDWQVCIKG